MEDGADTGAFTTPAKQGGSEDFNQWKARMDANMDTIYREAVSKTDLEAVERRVAALETGEHRYETVEEAVEREKRLRTLFKELMGRVEELEVARANGGGGAAAEVDPKTSSGDTRYRLVNARTKMGEVKYNVEMDDIYLMEVMGAVSEAAGQNVTIEGLMAGWEAHGKRSKEIMSEKLQRKVYQWVLSTLSGEEKRKIQEAAKTQDGVWALGILWAEMKENQRMRKEKAIRQYSMDFRGNTVG